MGKLRDFISYLNEQVQNHSIYVWGAQGQKAPTITETWILKREKGNRINANRAIRFWQKQVTAGYGDVLRAFDCSGLGMYWLQNLAGLCSHDMNANGLKGKCRPVSRCELRIGDFAFRVNAAGRATHIGYVVDNDLNIIEARGRDYGVVKGKPDSRWNAFGRPPYWTEEDVRELMGNTPDPAPAPFVFTRVLKFGCRGTDVCELKKMLKASGFGLSLTDTNPNYYSSTQKVVRTFQKAMGLKVDGKAGKQTVTALGGRWK